MMRLIRLLFFSITLVAGVAPLAADQVDAATAKKLQRFMAAMPDVDYPYEARTRRIMGSGVYDIWFDSKTGVATEVKILRSAGNPLLNDAAKKGLLRWRCRPGAFSHLQIPVRFVM